jgi:broad specificity phosphatase PhoE
VKTEDQAVAAGHSIDPARWQDTFEVLMGRIAGRFARVEPRRRAREFVLGLLSGLPRKNCWTLAEHAGDATPYGLQHLLSRAKWDADAVRDDLRGFVVEQLRDEDAVLVVDETGDLKVRVCGGWRCPWPYWSVRSCGRRSFLLWLRGWPMP